MNFINEINSSIVSIWNPKEVITHFKGETLQRRKKKKSFIYFEKQLILLQLLLQPPFL